MLKPVHKPLADVVFDQLRGQILGGQLEPGATLPSERALCELLKVHRGAVREGLKRLAQAQLIKIQHGADTRVLDYRSTAGTELLPELIIAPNGTLDIALVRGMIEMRAVLGPDLARLAALRGRATATPRLAAIIAEMERAAGDAHALHRLVLDYWEALVEASGNIPYRLIFNSFRTFYTRVEDALSHLLIDELSDLPAYRAIADAVAAGEAELARERSARLIQRGADRLFQALELIEKLNKGVK
jgi:GntR family transcriptional regulator, transcriptional repressor for pyruvate dehydrogenase complex